WQQLAARCGVEVAARWWQRVGSGVMLVVRWWLSCRQRRLGDGGRWQRGERDIVDRVDRVTRRHFGFAEKSPPEKFSGGGRVVVAGGRRLGGINKGSGLVRTSSSSTSYVPPLRNDWDLLSQSMFDELLNPPPIDQDVPSPSKSLTPTEMQSSVIPQDVGNDNLDIEVAHMGNDPLLGVPIPKVTSEQSSSTASPQSIVQPNHPMTHWYL
nr:hypothetical protein [Tanacetum cinerariifolium]